MRAEMKSLSTQLRQKGLTMVQESIDPNFGPVYTIESLKAGPTNSEVSYRLYYIGETTKWSASRRKAIAKAAHRLKAAEVVMKREASESD